MKKNIIILLFLFLVFPADRIMADQFADNVVAITVTRQGYNYNTPWQKSAIEKEIIIGTVIEGNRILTLSYKLANHILLEVSKFGSNRKYPGKVILKDYQSGLALIGLEDNSFFKDLNPVKIDYSGGSVKDRNVKVVRWDNYGILKIHQAEYLKSTVEFLESAGVILIHYLNAEITDAGRGEPVLAGNKLAGITSWHFPKDKMIKVIDIDVIRRMLKDAEDGRYDGMPFFDIEDAALDSDENLRNYLGLMEDDTGILVTGITPGTSGYGILKKGDVILNINGNNIEDNGLYIAGKYGRLNYHGIICLGHFSGDMINMRIIREKRKMDIVFILKQFSEDSFLIPDISYDKHPKFCIIGGLILQEFTKEYLKIWGKDWLKKADKRLMYYYDNYKTRPSTDRRRLVVLSAVLPATVNLGYHGLRNLILRKVNGIDVKDIAHAKELIDRSKSRYIEMDFIGNRKVVLNREKAVNSITEIMRKYNIHMPYYLQ